MSGDEGGNTVTDKEFVLSAHPDAHAVQYTEWDWVIYPFKHYQLASELGEASTEQDAWKNAADNLRGK